MPWTNQDRPGLSRHFTNTARDFLVCESPQKMCRDLPPDVQGVDVRQTKHGGMGRLHGPVMSPRAQTAASGSAKAPRIRSGSGRGSAAPFHLRWAVGAEGAEPPTPATATLSSRIPCCAAAAPLEAVACCIPSALESQSSPASSCFEQISREAKYQPVR